MSFGVIFASACCCLILIASIRNIIATIGKNKPEFNEIVIYAITPAGVSIGIFYYAFFVRDLDIVLLFSNYATINIWLDLVVSFILPTIILSGLFVSYHFTKNAILHFLIITAQSFIILIWGLIIRKTILLSQDFGPVETAEFPNALWSVAVIMTFLVVALFERHHKQKKKNEERQSKEAVSPALD